MYKKRFYYPILSVFAFLYIFSTNVFANVGIGSVVTQNTTSTPYTTQCSVTPYKYALYEGQSFSLHHTHTPSELLSTWEYFGASNVVTYNYQNVIGNSINGNSLGGKFTDFTYNSNGRLGTAKFSGIGGGIQTSRARKENSSNRAVKPSPNTNRANIVGQVVHILNRKQVASRGGSYFSMTTERNNSPDIYTKNADPSSYYGVEEDKKCQNFYIAKCGDGVRDDINKPGGSNTNGKQGIQTNDGFVTWIFPVATVIAEQCDGSDGIMAGYTCNALCQLVPIPQQADLSVTKTVNNAAPTVGSNVTFTMVLSNAGPYNANSVTLTDLLPNGYTYVSHSAHAGTTYNQSNGIWNVGTINVNTTKTLTITAQVKSTGNYVNTIEVTASDKTDPDSTPNNHIATEDDQASATVTPVLPAPTCALIVNPSSIVSGGLANVSWIITGNFVSPTWIYANPQILGSRPKQVSTPTGTTYASPTQAGTYTFTMTVMNINGLQNTCSATLNVGNPPPQSADLSVTKTVNNATPTVGFNVTFTMVLSNAGPNNAGGVTLKDLLPNGYTYVSHSAHAGTTYNQSNGIWNVGTINVNTTKTLTITAQVKSAGNYINTIEVTASDKPDPDSTPNNHIATEDDQASATVTPVSLSPNLTIQKTVISNIAYYSGDQIGFRINFQNAGLGIANNVTLTDILPSSLSYVSSAIFGVTANLAVAMSGANPVITYNGFNLAPGASGYMIITGTLLTNNAQNNRTNYVDIFASNHPLVSATVLFIVGNIPNNTVIFTKVGNKSTYQAGESIQFTISVTNQGPEVINNLTITDLRPNPSCITYTNRSSNDGFTNNANMSRSRLGHLAIGQTANLVLNGTISTNPSCAGNYNNIANLTYYVFGQLQTKTANFPFNVLAGSQCESLVSNYGTVILMEDGEGKAKFTCNTVNGIQANIRVDCGNGTSFNGFGGSIVDYCYYDDATQYTVKCYVDNTTNDQCTENIIVDEGMLGYCGNGKREGIEKCDIRGNDNDNNDSEPIEDDLDDYGLDAGRYANDGYYCENCAIKKQGYYEAPACNGISTTLSVQKGEVLPFRWELEGSNIVDEDDCEDADNGDILKDSLRCTFKVFNGKNNLQANDDPTLRITKDCDIDERDGHQMFDYFENLSHSIYPSLNNAFGKYYFLANNSNNGFLDDDVYGEYKLVLDKVSYDYCDGDDEENGTEVDRICEVNFAVTKPYLMQKSLFGATPKTSTVNLDDFWDMKGEKIINKTDISSIMKVDANDYDGGGKMDKQISDFINKYTKLSVVIPTNNLHTITNSTITEARKVPSKQIYIIKGTGKLTLKQLDSYFGKPFTIIVKGMDLIIEGSIKTNGMFVVQGGKISFKEDTSNRCKSTQIVQGIFISDIGFGVGDTTLNILNKLDEPRCNRGGLNVKGVLIGNGIDTLVKQRRSQLNDRFRVHSSDEDKIKIERRNKIFNGASVLIEYSPALRGNLPPGASDFTKALEVYKK